jgi:hypothetical protein
MWVILIFLNFMMKLKITTLFVLAFLQIHSLSAQKQGIYFSKKEYIPSRMIPFSEARDKLPSPIYDEDTAYVSCYWKAWEIAFKNFYEPAQGSGFVSQFADAAFNENAFAYDASFLTMFLNYGHPYVPGISTLDNFYARQHENGEICREINRSTGADCELWINKERKPLYSVFGAGFGGESWTINYINRPPPKTPSYNTLDALNNPVLAWAELESYKITGDKARLEMVWEPLLHYHLALEEYLRQGNGLYITDWASMDNSPRNIYLNGGGCGIDISSQMVLFANQLSEIAEIIGKTEQVKIFEIKSKITGQNINKLMWDRQNKFYYDLTLKNQLIKIKTVAGFWPLLAKISNAKQIRELKLELNNNKTFNRINRVPTLAAEENEFNPKGGYWKGAVWSPTTTMVIKGLESNGLSDLAREIALNHLHTVVEVYKKTSTIWENYAPDTLSCGILENNSSVKDDFVGWSGMAPIRFFIEYAIGVRADAPTNTIEWTITSNKRIGIEKFWFAGNTLDLIAMEAGPDGLRQIRISAEKTFKLTIIMGKMKKELNIPENGTTEFKM